MTLSHGEGIYGDGAGVVTPLEHRLAQIGPYSKTTTANVIRAGLFYNGTPTIVSGTANMSYNVAAFSAVSTRGATQGVVPFANDATANVATTAAPGSNSRIDVVYAWPRDFAIDGTDSTPVLGVVQGTAAASPTVPSLAAYPGAIELARITVPAGVTATNSGTTITQTAPFTTVDGSPIPFRSTTEMNLWTPSTYQRGWDISTGLYYQYTGSAWILLLTQERYQADTSNSVRSVIEQSGIGKISGAVSATLSEAVTFPTAFGGVPVVTASMLGQRTAGAFNPAGLTASQSLLANPQIPSTTGFTQYIYQTTGGNLSASNDYYYAWIARGIPA